MPVAGAAGQAYTVTANGSYAVIVTQAGCTDTSACHQVFTIGVEEAENGGDIVFYPNPSDGQLFVQSSGIIEQIGLLAINGQLLYTLRPAANYAVLNLETYPAGVYLLRIETGGKTVFRKIIRR